MTHELPPGFQRISGKRKPPTSGPFYIMLRTGFVDLSNTYTREQLVWIHDGGPGDVVAVKLAV
jgi:hypothetical protein